MELEVIILSEANQIEKDKYHIILLLYGIKKIIQMNIYENEIEPQTESNIITIGESGRRINEEFGIHIYTYIYKIGNKGPTV